MTENQTESTGLTGAPTDQDARDRKYLEHLLCDNAPVWAEDFNGGPGTVISVSDAATVFAKESKEQADNFRARWDAMQRYWSWRLQLHANADLTHDWWVSADGRMYIHGGQPDDDGHHPYLIEVIEAPGGLLTATEQIAAALRGEA